MLPKIASFPYGDKRKMNLHNSGMPSEIWERVRALRKYADLTQQEVANACKISREAVSQWESKDPKKRTTPTNNNLWALLGLVKKKTGRAVSINWLFNDRYDAASLYTPAADARRDEWALTEESTNVQEDADLLRAWVNLPPEVRSHIWCSINQYFGTLSPALQLLVYGSPEDKKRFELYYPDKAKQGSTAKERSPPRHGGRETQATEGSKEMTRTAHNPRARGSPAPKTQAAQRTLSI